MHHLDRGHHRNPAVLGEPQRVVGSARNPFCRQGDLGGGGSELLDRRGRLGDDRGLLGGRGRLLHGTGGELHAGLREGSAVLLRLSDQRAQRADGRLERRRHHAEVVLLEARQLGREVPLGDERQCVRHLPEAALKPAGSVLGEQPPAPYDEPPQQREQDAADEQHEAEHTEQQRQLPDRGGTGRHDGLGHRDHPVEPDRVAEGRVVRRARPGGRGAAVVDDTAAGGRREAEPHLGVGRRQELHGRGRRRALDRGRAQPAHRRVDLEHAHRVGGRADGDRGADRVLAERDRRMGARRHGYAGPGGEGVAHPGGTAGTGREAGGGHAAVRDAQHLAPVGGTQPGDGDEAGADLGERLQRTAGGLHLGRGGRAGRRDVGEHGVTAGEQAGQANDVDLARDAGGGLARRGRQRHRLARPLLLGRGHRADPEHAREAEEHERGDDKQGDDPAERQAGRPVEQREERRRRMRADRPPVDRAAGFRSGSTVDDGRGPLARVDVRRGHRSPPAVPR